MSDRKTESTPMEVVRVRWVCGDECDGEMKAGNFSYSCNPPLYPHDCDKCGRSENSHIRYPTLEYRTKERERTA